MSSLKHDPNALFPTTAPHPQFSHNQLVEIMPFPKLVANPTPLIERPKEQIQGLWQLVTGKRKRQAEERSAPGDFDFPTSGAHLPGYASAGVEGIGDSAVDAVNDQ